MLPRLHELDPTQAIYVAFLEALQQSGFKGDINTDYANRVVLATDNSIYQQVPQAVLFPHDVSDVRKLCRLVAQEQWRPIVIAPRGGGTGTNAQSLTDGIVVDLSKHMNAILEINVEEGWVRVQAGVVKDQLNAALRPHGLFFAPELSTSNRATIGGMINTDASGQGSVRYGKTRDHVLGLRTVLLGGELLVSAAVPLAQARQEAEATDRRGQITATLIDIFQRRQGDIDATFPTLNRCLTGYDLAHLVEQDQFNLNAVLCGSEGTLGFVTEATLNVLPIPKVSAVVNVFYSSFEASLRDARQLMKAKPTSIETIDSSVFQLAQNDISWQGVADYFAAADGDIAGINLVEYTADSAAELEQGIERLMATLKQKTASNCGYSVALGKEAVNKIWAMRKRAVGLLGNVTGEARPVAFVEDTAVPPENLADFIIEFRAILEGAGLSYGMFGHVDAGVLHVRPALDLKDRQQQARVRDITDQVVALVQQYKGLLWGEHGKGVRSEFGPQFFGDLYPELQRIKRIFDPYNQLNPGKIASPDAQIPLLKIDQVRMRADFDRNIASASWTRFNKAVHCNGNGACFNYDPQDAMCPSWKATRERRHSPKGRASLIREWLRLLSAKDYRAAPPPITVGWATALATLPKRLWHSWQKTAGQYDFSHEVAASMAACLACKSCSNQCPVKVDVPDFRARFLQLYHSRYLRPPKDYAIGLLEFIVPLLSAQPFKNGYNWLLQRRLVSRWLKNSLGMVDSPPLHQVNLQAALRKRRVFYADINLLLGLKKSEKERSVIIVQDAFTSYFETPVVLAVIDCLQCLGLRVWVMPFHANGKPLHVHGFLSAFSVVAKRTAAKLETLAASGIPLVGIDPSMTLAYRDEYQSYVGTPVPKVQLLQEFLVAQHTRLQEVAHRFVPGEVQLLSHCTEKTGAAQSTKDWLKIFSTLNQSVKPMATGCCGMAGTYGHETRNRHNSEKIYDLSWRQIVNDSPTKPLVATGYSCRSQVKRLDNRTALHPLAYLLRQHQGPTQ